MQKKNFMIILSLIVFSIGLNAATRVTPINPAEAVFAPFWDYDLGEMKKWKTNSGQLSQVFTGTVFSWEKRDSAPGKPAFEAVRNEPFSCAGYDQFIYCGKFPPGAKFRIVLDTDKGERTAEWDATRPFRDEYMLPLQGASEIRKITVRVFDTGKNNVRSGQFLWMGLRNDEQLRLLLEQRQRFAQQPLDLFLAPKGTVPSFKGKVNLLGAPAELAKVQEAYQQRKKELGQDFISEKDLDRYEPEKLLADTLPFANEYIFGRVRDENRNFKQPRELIQKAVIARNPKMMELAVRTALVYALTPNWDTAFLSDFADSGWDQRVFSNTVVAESVALALDYGDDLLSEAGRSLLQKRLALEGLGQINYNIWRYTYLFGNNQLTVFTRGRIAAYLTLEKSRGWNGPRVKPYTELAMNELYDSLASLVYEDGSFLEGPAYFFYTLSNAQPILEMYSSVRNKKMSDVLPPRLKKLGAFADVFISTDRRGGLIPFSSGQGEGRHASAMIYQFLSLLAPDSQWTTLYHDKVRQMGSDWVADVAFLTNRSQVAPGPVPPKAFTVLPTMGMMASTRFFEGRPVKILLAGTRKNTQCHRHNDRGSFVLEFDGDTYAADPGGQNYADADADNVKRSDYHNMLVPADMPDNEPLAVSRENVYPVGKGDEKSFRAEILPAPSSYNYFTEWKRTVDSPTPDKFTIADDYVLTPGRKAARFVWITELPWKKVDDTTIRLDGQTSYALIRFPKDLTFSVETLTIRRKEKFSRLSFEKKAPSGRIEIKVELFRKK